MARAARRTRPRRGSSMAPCDPAPTCVATGRPAAPPPVARRPRSSHAAARHAMEQERRTLGHRRAGRASSDTWPSNDAAPSHVAVDALRRSRASCDAVAPHARHTSCNRVGTDDGARRAGRGRVASRHWRVWPHTDLCRRQLTCDTRPSRDARARRRTTRVT